MQSQNRFFDDLTRMAGGAVGALGGVKGELEALVRQQFERILRDMDLVGREEFDAVRAMASEARAEQENRAGHERAPRGGKAAPSPRGVKAGTPPRAAAARLRRAARKKRA